MNLGKLMIRVYTKERHIKKIENYLNSLNLEHQIYTVKDIPKLINRKP